MDKQVREALEWYASEAEAIARHLEQFKTNPNEGAILASLQVLALDGGRRARSAIDGVPSGCIASDGTSNKDTK